MNISLELTEIDLLCSSVVKSVHIEIQIPEFHSSIRTDVAKKMTRKIHENVISVRKFT